MSYLGNLTLRLAAGAMQLPDEFRRRHADYLAQGRREDGGFAGRQGKSDLYYTGFAVRGLTLLGALSEEDAEHTAGFLQASLSQNLPAIDFLSLVFASVLLEVSYGIDVFDRARLDRRKVIQEQLEPLRRPDGGFAKTPKSGRSSTYQTFLSVACMQLIGAKLDGPEHIAELVNSRRRPDGGYCELDAITRSGTNPTAAAVGLLRLLQDDHSFPLHGPEGEKTSRFIAAMQSADGGLRANTLIPISDLLSTCTGLIALVDLNGLNTIDLDAARRYVDSMESDTGGFRGGTWDTEIDTEYTFYGLATRALLTTLET